MTIKLLFLSLNLFVVYDLMKRTRVLPFIVIAFYITLMLNFVLSFNNFAGISNVYTLSRFNGTMHNSNELGIFSLISLIISTYIIISNKKGKITLHHFMVIISIYVILITGCKKALLAGIVIILYLIWSERRNIRNISILAAGILVFSFVYYFHYSYLLSYLEIGFERYKSFYNTLQGGQEDYSTLTRIEYIRLGLDLFIQNPLYGHGINTFRTFADKYSHNNYIELLSGVGITGTFLYYRVYWQLFKGLKKIQSDRVIYRFLLVTLLCFLVMDVALVSYYYKIVLLTLVFISIFSEDSGGMKSIGSDRKHMTPASQEKQIFNSKPGSTYD